MKKIQWCCNTKNGIELITPSNNLSKAYLKKSENAMNAVSALKGNIEWEISSGYYTMYFAFYSILMKIGIKCEIHACTIEFMKYFLNKYFSKKDYFMLKRAMDARIDAQYYISDTIKNSADDTILTYIPEFIVKCKQVIINLKEKDINEIRESVKKVLKG